MDEPKLRIIKNPLERIVGDHEVITDFGHLVPADSLSIASLGWMISALNIVDGQASCLEDDRTGMGQGYQLNISIPGKRGNIGCVIYSGDKRTYSCHVSTNVYEDHVKEFIAFIQEGGEK